MRGYRGIKYTIFICCYIFSVVSAILTAVGIYAKIAKEKDVVDTLTLDPALLLIVVGSVMFLITFLGCFGALRNTTCLLKLFLGILVAVLLLQIAAGVVGYVFTDMVMERTERLMMKAIIRYREDRDLENAIDFIQKKTVLNTMCGYGVQQLEESSAGQDVFTIGCLQRIASWAKNNLLLVAGLTAGLLLLEYALYTVLDASYNFTIIDMPALRKWWCVMPMENFNLGSPHLRSCKKGAEWVEAQNHLLSARVRLPDAVNMGEAELELWDEKLDVEEDEKESILEPFKFRFEQIKDMWTFCNEIADKRRYLVFCECISNIEF
ncbi:tetraspanin-33 isoform X2 [Eleginops maclovinus]|uniref:tetraspanin-33 isoform X2 n=1 Tax=Eleginops maclovinus TaxID=56733 RepID=UPI003080325D